MPKDKLSSGLGGFWREKEHPVTQGAHSGKLSLRLIDCDDVGQALYLVRLDKLGRGPRFSQLMQGVELQAV